MSRVLEKARVLDFDLELNWTVLYKCFTGQAGQRMIGTLANPSAANKCGRCKIRISGQLGVC